MKDVASLQNAELGPQADALRGKSKLGANNSGERFEKEADRAADVVTSGRAPLFDFSRIAVRGERPPDASGPEIARVSWPVEDEFESALEEPVEDELIDVMRKAASATEIPQSPVDAQAALRAPGQPLDEVTRRSMESRFGFDFGKVRIHTGNSAQDSARALDAHAYTLGPHIAFGNNEYAPHTERGRHLLAHELTHTIQQQDVPQPMPQCAEFGTYVSNKGAKNYLDAGARYYTDWGFPNVKRVDTVKDVLDDLDRSKGTIDTFRIVSHGNSAGLELGAVQGLTSQPTEGLDMKDWFTRKGAEFQNETRFRKHYTDAKTASFVNETFFQRIVRDLRKDATMQPILARLGAGKDTPAIDSPTGIVMRGLVDRFYLGKVKLDTGGTPTFKNRAVLDQFVNLRIGTFQPVAVQSVALAQQADFEKALGEFAVALNTSFDAAKLKFDDITAEDAKTFADTYLDPDAKTPKLHSDIVTSLSEGKEGGGPYLKKLRSVKGKIGSNTHIEIRGCNVGEDTNTLDSFREFFGQTGNLPSISAPDLYQYFFQLNFSTFTKNPADVASLETAFNTSDTGVATAFEDRKRLQAGEMMRVVNERSLDALAKKYGHKLADLERWNPQITNPAALKPGEEVWLVMRPAAPAGKHKTLKAFCKDYIGDEKAEADVKSANAQIKPDALVETDEITIPANRQSGKVAAPKPKVADFVSAVRGGDTITAINASNKPVTYLDDPKRATSLGAWLEKQQFDPKGRSAAQLSALYAGANFSTQAARTHLNFLSRDYPNIVDPIFPEDQRYSKHIIRRP